MHIVLPDGNSLEFSHAATGQDVAAKIGPGLAKAARAIRANGELFDLLTPLPDGANVEIITDVAEVPELYRHTLAHMLAQAVREQLVSEGFDAKDIKLAIGPVIENGFYYDMDLPRSLTPEDLPVLEQRMRDIRNQKLPLARFTQSTEDALAYFAEWNDPYKRELIEDLGDEELSFYSQGGSAGFVDLCRGPHVPNTGDVPAHFQLTSIAGAYWRGDETRPMLQRVYGIAFATKDALDHHLWQLAEARKRDHRKLGAELDIFVLDDEVGPGLPLWLPRGAIMADEIEALAKEMEDKGGYQRVRTPHLTKEDLFIKSGHLPFYEEDMFPPMELDNVRYFIKPMNCPFHHKIFAARKRSYRELPLRLTKYNTCYRYEDSGALMGLMRVRSMQMNDAHIYCAEDQFEEEFLNVINLYLEYFKIFGIDDYVMRLSKHSKEGLGEKYVDNEPLWIKTEDMVRQAMIRGGIPFVEAEDEAAFYGPKIDVQIKSAIGREFTLATNQVDFAVPKRFNLTYIDENNERQTPLCLHRAPLSTHERLIGFLIEHFAGDFPLWLAPEQVRIVPIADRHIPYAETVQAALSNAGLRAEVDASGERMNAKIREAELYKVPYTVIVGDSEEAEREVSFRSRQEPRQNGVALDKFVGHLQAHKQARSLTIEPLS